VQALAPNSLADDAGPPLSVEDLSELHRRVVRVRRFEERVVQMYANGDIPGFVHTCLGEEATAVGPAGLSGIAMSSPRPTGATGTAWRKG